MGAGDELAGLPLRGDLLHVDVRMKQQDAQQIAARIPGPADDGSAYHARASRATWATIFAGMSTPVVSMLLRNSIV